MAQRIDFAVESNIGNVADPVNVGDAATKRYVDAQVNSGGADYRIDLGNVYQAISPASNFASYDAGANVNGIVTGTATFNTPQSASSVVLGIVTITGIPDNIIAVNDPIILADINGTWNISESYILSKSGTGVAAIYTLALGVFNSQSSLPVGTYSIEVALLNPTSVASLNGGQGFVTVAAGSGISVATATTNNVTNISVSNTGLFYNGGFIFNNAIVNNRNIETLNTIQGNMTQLVISDEGVGDGQNIVNYFINNGQSAVYRFQNDTVEFSVGTASLLNANTANVVLVGTVNFVNSIPALTNVQIRLREVTSFTDVILNPTLGGAVAQNQFNRPALTLNVNPPTATVIGGVKAGANVTIAADGTISTTAGGVDTLQELTDVSIVEPTFTQIGTYTVASVATNSIQLNDVVTNIINVGDYVRGTNTAGSPTIQVIGVFNNGLSLEFNGNPASYFAVGNSVYRLPSTIDNDSLVWSNSANRWVAKSDLSEVPVDVVPWVANNRQVYATTMSSPIVIATITTNLTILTNNWTFSLPSLPGLNSFDEVAIVDNDGRFATGTYVAAAQAGGSYAVFENVLPDRLSGGGWAVNSSYIVKVRKGTNVLGKYSGNGGLVYEALDNIGGYDATINYSIRYTASATFNQAQFANDAINGTLTFTSVNATGPSPHFSVNQPLLIESVLGDWNVTDCYITAITGTSDPTAVYTTSAVSFNSDSDLAAGSYPVIVSVLSPSSVGSINNVLKNVTIEGAGSVTVTTQGQVITVNGGQGTASTIYNQGIRLDGFGSAAVTSWLYAPASYAFIGVPSSDDATGGEISGISYIYKNTFQNTYGFGTRMPVSLGGSNTPYSDLTFRISPPTLRNLVVPVSNAGAAISAGFVVEVVLVNSSVWGTGNAYGNSAQFPLLRAVAEGSLLVPIHPPVVTGITTGTAPNTVNIASITGGLWVYTTPTNTAYTGSNTDYVVVYYLAEGDGPGTFSTTGAITVGSVDNDGSLEIDLSIGSGAVETPPTLQQVLATGNTTGNNNISLTGTGRLSGPVTALNITGGTAGQFLQTDGAGNQTWAAGGSGGSQTLNQVLATGKTATSANSSGLTLFSDQVSPFTFTNLASEIIVGTNNAKIEFDPAGNFTFGTNANSVNINYGGTMTAVDYSLRNGTSTGLLFVTTAGLSLTSNNGNLPIFIGPNGTGNVILGNNATYSAWNVLGGQSDATLSATGGLLDINAKLVPKGDGDTILGNTTGSTGITIEGGLETSINLLATGTSTAIDFILTPKGAGNLYPIGNSISATTSLQPHIFVASAQASTTLGAGLPGQVLSSNGTSGAPYWSDVSVTYNAMFFVKASDQFVSGGGIVVWPTTPKWMIGNSFGTMGSSGIFTFSQTGTYMITFAFDMGVPNDGWGVFSGDSYRYIEHSDVSKLSVSEPLQVTAVNQNFYILEFNGTNVYSNQSVSTSLFFEKLK